MTSTRTPEETAAIVAALQDPCECGHTRGDHNWWTYDCILNGPRKFCPCSKFRKVLTEYGGLC